MDLGQRPIVCYWRQILRTDFYVLAYTRGVHIRSVPGGKVILWRRWIHSVYWHRNNICSLCSLHHVWISKLHSTDIVTVMYVYYHIATNAQYQFENCVKLLFCLFLSYLRYCCGFCIYLVGKNLRNSWSWSYVLCTSTLTSYRLATFCYYRWLQRLVILMAMVVSISYE